MKKYEIMYILNATLDEESRTKEIEKLHSILTGKGAKVTNVNEWGVKDFAYEIKDQKKGYYVVIKVTADDSALNEFSRLARIDENVVRYLVTKDFE